LKVINNISNNNNKSIGCESQGKVVKNPPWQKQIHLEETKTPDHYKRHGGSLIQWWK